MAQNVAMFSPKHYGGNAVSMKQYSYSVVSMKLNNFIVVSTIDVVA